MSNQLESQIASYQRWREDIRTGIEAYQLWLDQQRISLKKQGDQLDQLRATLAPGPATAARSAHGEKPVSPSA